MLVRRRLSSVARSVDRAPCGLSVHPSTAAGAEEVTIVAGKVRSSSSATLAPSPVDTARWVLPVLGVAAAMVAGVAVFADPAELFERTGAGLASALLHVVILTPLALLAARGRPGSRRALLAAAGFLLLSFVMHTLPSVGFFAAGEWNWQGKTFELIWLAVLLIVLARWARDDVGVRRPTPGSLRPSLGVIVVAFTVQAALVYLGVASGEQTFSSFGSTERLLFDLGHPNLVEELLWRGVLLALLDRVLGTPWRLCGAQVGWGLVLTTVSFGLVHGLLVTPDGLMFAPGQLLLTGLLGLLFGWVRARTGSVWLAYLAHCAPELGIHAGVAAAAGA